MSEDRVSGLIVSPGLLRMGSAVDRLDTQRVLLEAFTSLDRGGDGRPALVMVAVPFERAQEALERATDWGPYKRVYTYECSQGHEWRGAVVGAVIPCPWCAVNRAERAETLLREAAGTLTGSEQDLRRRIAELIG